MDTNHQNEAEGGGLLFPHESHEIVGCAMEVHNELGHGFREKGYENSLTVLFHERQIPFSQQLRFPLMFRGVKVDEFIPDLVVYEKIIVDAETVDRIGPVEIGQMLNYLRASGLKLAIILNFKNPRLEVRRVVL